MRPDEPDRAPLWDMLTHARGLVASLRDASFHDFIADETLRLATERRIEIIGEAARQVSEHFQTSTPDIPWRKIVAQRHVLAHEYGQIDPALIWRVATVHIPKLLEQLESFGLEGDDNEGGA